MSIRNPRQLGALLRDRREAAGFTQATLARQLKVSTKWVSTAEHGSPGTSVGTLLRALELVGVELAVARPERSMARSTANRLEIPDIDAIVARASRAKPDQP